MRKPWALFCARLAAAPLFIASALTACGGETREQAPPERATGDEEVVTMSELQRWNERARAGAVVDTLHGVEVPDPYRALEEDSALTQGWMDFQSERTDAAVASWARPETTARLGELLSIGTVSGGVVRGGQVFFTRRDGDQEQAVLMVMPLAGGEPRLLVDPTTYGERASLDWYYPSPSGRFIALGIAANGDERATLRVLTVASGELLPDSIDHAKWSSVTWLQSEQGFYYRRYPREGEAGYDAERPDAYNTRLFFHTLGAPSTEDPLVFSPEDPHDFPSAVLSADDRWLVISNSRGWSSSDLYVFDRGARAASRAIAPDAEHPATLVAQGEGELYYAGASRDRLFIGTNAGAPRWRIDSVPFARAADRSAWTTVVPESASAAIEDWALAGDRLILHVVDDVRSRVLVRGQDGRGEAEITLPGRGSLAGLSADQRTGDVVYGFSSFVHAPALFAWSPRARAPREIAHVDCPVDLSAFEVTRESVTSADGTEVPVHLVQRRGLERDGNAPVFLTGYGGFNISLLPGFQRNALYWMERGGVYAVANLRGGSEFGEDWHQAGRGANKHHVFEDMEAVIRWFSTSGISRPERIAITGRSNGGLLMGAMITRAPETFAAAATYVGLYDMIRFHHFPPADIWTEEYGSPEDAEAFQWLLDYSPYHRVGHASRIPPVLIETADHDTRVHWFHSTKLAARLQEASGEADPHVWFYRQRDIGHGAGTRRTDMITQYARLYAFVEHHVGL